MLIQFSFKNFRSFRDESILDMTATKKTEFSDSLATIGKEKILPVAAIFGSNASGKSNVYGAFVCMSQFVVRSFRFGDDNDEFEMCRPRPFAFSKETENADTTFEVYFTIPEDTKSKMYNYGFCVNNTEITEEWLNTKAKTAKEFKPIFYRGNKLELDGLTEQSQRNIKAALEKQTLIISLGAKLRIDICKKVRDWFGQNSFADFGDPVMNYFNARTMPEGFAENVKEREKVVRFFSSFDDSIKGFHVEKLKKENDEKGKDTYSISTYHKMIDSNRKAEIQLSEESAGTLKMFSLYPDLVNVLQNGSVFFVDELNARLHPLLVRNIILAFTNPEYNPKHAQLVFTTHDTWQLSNLLLRRDEIWFTEKDENGISTLYSLADFADEDGNRIRKDESYEKNYLLGKYGAIPNLESINFFKGE